LKFVFNKNSLLPAQRRFWDSKKFMPALVEGYGAGKTYVHAKRALYLSYVNAGLPGMMVSPTYKLAKRTTIHTIQEMMDRAGLNYTINKNDNEIRIKNWNGLIWWGSGDDPNSLRGPNLAWAGIDEPFIQSEDVFDQMIARVRHPDATLSQIFLTGTPEELNWGARVCIDEPEKYDVDLITGSTRENIHLPDDYLQRLLSSYSENQIKAYVDGAFVNLTKGRVYDPFDRVKSNDVRTDISNLPIIAGLDFNVGKLVCIIAARIGKDRLHVFDEIVLKDSDTFEMAEVLSRKYPGIPVYPDPAGNARHTSSTKSDHQILRDHGFMVIARKSHPPVKGRVNAVNGMLRNGLMTIDVAKCKELAIDLERVVWKGNDIDKRDDARTHATDALGYPTEYLWPVNRGFVGSIMR
jgi:PBSX family phage terminase large subunit